MSTATAGHTLATGTTLASKFGSFGIANKRMIKPLERLFGHIFGRANSGKTSLFSGYPGALIINCDGSSTPVPSADAPPPVAQFFPGFNDAGQPVGVDGQSLILNWAAIEKLRDSLIEAAVANRPRPTTIVLDSVMSAMALIKAHLVEIDKVKPNRQHVKEWTDLHGEAAWESLYSRLAQFASSLLPHYGVWFITHLSDKFRTDGGVERKVLELTTPPGFLPRFNPLFELAIGTEARLSPKTEETVTMFQGKPLINKVTVMNKKVFLTGETPDLVNIYKHRIALPISLELPPGKEWDTLAEAYRKAAEPKVG